MFTDICLFAPQYVINCVDHSNSGDIYSLMRSNNIGPAFVYTMTYCVPKEKTTLVKIGRSSPELRDRKYQLGERLVRQIAGLNGWNEDQRVGGNVFEFREACILKGVFNRHDNHKNYLSISLWDISKRLAALGLILTSEFDATSWAEGELAHQYKQISGDKLPPLNIQDPSLMPVYTRRGYISAASQHLFVKV